MKLIYYYYYHYRHHYHHHLLALYLWLQKKPCRPVKTKQDLEKTIGSKLSRHEDYYASCQDFIMVHSSKGKAYSNGDIPICRGHQLSAKRIQLCMQRLLVMPFYLEIDELIISVFFIMHQTAFNCSGCPRPSIALQYRIVGAISLKLLGGKFAPKLVYFVLRKEPLKLK